jgi:hypothetical protein
VNIRTEIPNIAAASILVVVAGVLAVPSSVHVAASRAGGAAYALSDQPEPLPPSTHPGATTDPTETPIIGSPPPNGGKKPNLL